MAPKKRGRPAQAPGVRATKKVSGYRRYRIMPSGLYPIRSSAYDRATSTAAEIINLLEDKEETNHDDNKEEAFDSATSSAASAPSSSSSSSSSASTATAASPSASSGGRTLSTAMAFAMNKDSGNNNSQPATYGSCYLIQKSNIANEVSGFQPCVLGPQPCRKYENILLSPCYTWWNFIWRGELCAQPPKVPSLSIVTRSNREDNDKTDEEEDGGASDGSPRHKRQKRVALTTEQRLERAKMESGMLQAIIEKNNPATITFALKHHIHFDYCPDEAEWLPCIRGLIQNARFHEVAYFVVNGFGRSIANFKEVYLAVQAKYGVRGPVNPDPEREGFRMMLNACTQNFTGGRDASEPYWTFWRDYVSASLTHALFEPTNSEFQPVMDCLLRDDPKQMTVTGNRVLTYTPGVNINDTYPRWLIYNHGRWAREFRLFMNPHKVVHNHISCRVGDGLSLRQIIDIHDNFDRHCSVKDRTPEWKGDASNSYTWQWSNVEWMRGTVDRLRERVVFEGFGATAEDHRRHDEREQQTGICDGERDAGEELSVLAYYTYFAVKAHAGRTGVLSLRELLDVDYHHQSMIEAHSFEARRILSMLSTPAIVWIGKHTLVMDEQAYEGLIIDLRWFMKQAVEVFQPLHDLSVDALGPFMAPPIIGIILEYIMTPPHSFFRFEVESFQSWQFGLRSGPIITPTKGLTVVTDITNLSSAHIQASLALEYWAKFIEMRTVIDSCRQALKVTPRSPYTSNIWAFEEEAKRAAGSPVASSSSSSPSSSSSSSESAAPLTTFRIKYQHYFSKKPQDYKALDYLSLTTACEPPHLARLMPYEFYSRSELVSVLDGIYRFFGFDATKTLQQLADQHAKEVKV